MAQLTEIHGNIFNTKMQTIVNTVNCVGVMGKGIALEFKYRYPEMFKSYADVCREKLLTPGKLLLWKQTTPWILNFPTKSHWKLPSKIEYLELGLKKFADTYKGKKIRSIAFPLLGTQAGGLKQEDVLHLMKTRLEQLENLLVEIYHFSPNQPDNWFFHLEEIIKSGDSDLFRNKKDCDFLKTTYERGLLKSMYDLHRIKGIGKSKLANIYAILAQRNKNVARKESLQLLELL